MPNTFNNAQAQLSSTSVTDVYQAPATTGNTAVVLSVLCANVNGTASADISIIKTNSSNTIQSYLAFTIPVPADTSLEVVANKIILKAGEKLRAQASASNFINVTISALEIT
jgi:3D (Asp-Asp-Asp) domain-containing protein